MILVAELMASAYSAHLQVTVAVHQGRRAKVAARDLETLLELVIPDLMLEHQGIDGDLTWWIALRQLDRRRGAIEERVLMDNPSARVVFETTQIWRAFLGRLSTSPAGRTWGHFETRIPRKWS